MPARRGKSAPKKSSKPSKSTAERPAAGETTGPVVAFVPIERIVRDPLLQHRRFRDESGKIVPGQLTDPEWVAELVKFRQDGGTYERRPTVVTDGETYWAAGGFHRIEADERCGHGSIECDVYAGDYREALFLSLRENAAHGLKRSEDCAVAAVHALLDAPDLMRRVYDNLERGDGGVQRTVARITGTAKGTVYKVLEQRGEHVRGGRVVKKPAPAPAPEPPAAGRSDTPEEDDAEPDHTGHLSGGRLSSPGDEDERDGREPDDAPAYTAPRELSPGERLADYADTFRGELERFAESGDGAEFLGAKDGRGEPFVRDITGDVGGAVALGNEGKADGYLSSADQKAHGVLLSGPGAGARSVRYGRCAWLRELADALRGRRSAVSKAA